MKLLLDTNVVLDVVLERHPHHMDSARVLAACERGQAQGFLCAVAVTTVYYIVGKTRDARHAEKAVELLLGICQIAEVDRRVLQSALALGFSDCEDAVTHQASVKAACDRIVTRNAAHFRKATLPVHSPAEICSLLRI